MTRDSTNTDINIPKLKRCADYIRYLALECIERATSGHPGLPLGCAELGVLLYRYILKYNPKDPKWVNRDRFILSAGHGSMLLYSLLYLAGYNGFSLENLGAFRQLGSNTPGHPEYSLDEGVETTTGPLGQGFANAVGCAVEGKILAQRFNEENFELFDYTVFTLMGDGCNMEGISYEAGSIAGHLGLDNLVAVYDCNDVSIDGHMNITFTEDVGKRYGALGWYVEHADIRSISDVFTKLKKLKGMRQGKPKILILKTIIGEGLDKKKNTPGIHGAPAGIDEIVFFIQHSQIRDIFEKEYGKEAVDEENRLPDIMEVRLREKVPLDDSESKEFMRERLDEAIQVYKKWEQKLEVYKEKHVEKRDVLTKYLEFTLPEKLQTELLNYEHGKPDATRGISGRVLNLCAGHLPQLVGGVADLAGSTKANIKAPGEKEIPYIQRDMLFNRNIAFGVREHAMGAIGNGLALNNVMIPFTSTFFTFFDYMKPAVRMAALMKLNHLFIYSHDSIYVGEDGPTHQPIEHLNALRVIPGIHVFRPASDFETAFSYLYFLQHMNGPAAIITSRQKIPGNGYPASNSIDRQELYNQFKKGAYVFYETNGTNEPDIILSASGSELALALETAKKLEIEDNKQVRVVSIPCLELLREADENYRRQLFIPGKPLVLIEAASHRSVNLFYDPRIILVDIETFGESAPAKDVGEHFGFTADKVYRRIKEAL
jgi:transketolase